MDISKIKGWEDIKKWLKKKTKDEIDDDEDNMYDMNNSVSKARKLLKVTEELSPATDSRWEDFEKWAKLNVHARELKSWLERAKVAYDAGDDDTMAALLDELKG